jgi:hypothetical protein
MIPLRIKSSAYPASSSNIQGLQEMTDAEIEQYISATVTKAFSDASDGTETGDININGSGTAIGSTTDTKRDDAVGTHPTDGASSTVTTYQANQIRTSVSESYTSPLAYLDSGDVGMHEYTDAELDTNIIDKIADDMVAQGSYTTGQYSLSASAPSGGTWTSRYVMADTQVDGTTANKTIWQKTTATTSADTNWRPLKVESGGSGVKQMSDAEVGQLLPNLRNYIVSSGKGYYALQSAAPGTGTWVQQGDAYTDTKKDVASQNYSGAYAGNYSGNYTGNYTGAKNYSGTYSGSYTGNYVGSYTGTSAYAGAYSGAYSGSYAQFYSGFAGTYYTGSYTGSYTGYYTGAKSYSGTYSGAYSGSYTGTYVGTSAYAGTYSGTYTGYYTGTYAGDTIQSSSSTMDTVRLWLRTA